MEKVCIELLAVGAIGIPDTNSWSKALMGLGGQCEGGVGESGVSVISKHIEDDGELTERERGCSQSHN